jgi:glutamate-1-semialdehyde 2,1-aminomutase
MWGFFFAADPVLDFDGAKRSDVTMFRRFFHAALDRGVYLAPSQFESAFMSGVHTDEDIRRTVTAAKEALDDIARE